MPAVIPDLDAPLVPGVSAAGIIVGTQVNALWDQSPPLDLKAAFDLHCLPFPVSAGLGLERSNRSGCVDSGYRGLLDSTLGIGSTIAGSKIPGSKIPHIEAAV